MSEPMGLLEALAPWATCVVASIVVAIAIGPIEIIHLGSAFGMIASIAYIEVYY